MELKHLESSLSDQKNEMENGVENLEGKKKVRDHERKEILLLEMKLCDGARGEQDGTVPGGLLQV